jgi:RNA polymerase sigma-70 factor, ECF subfamily
MKAISTGFGRRPQADEQLVEAVQAGEVAAFDELVLRWERKIQGAIYRIVGREEDARDICQETFLKAFRGIRSFKKEARFSSWLYQIAINLCRDRLRRRKGRFHVGLEELDEGAEEMTLSGPSALDMVQARDLSRLVSSAIATLPEEQREVIVLKEYEGLTFPEIAESLQIPTSTVKTRLYRGLVQLRLQLERQGIRGVAPVPAAAPCREG